MTVQVRTVDGLLLPLTGFHLVLPQSMVAEIAPRPEIMPVNNSAGWLIGKFTWRMEEVPLISFEKLCGEARTVVDDRSYVAILHGLEGPSLIYYAIELKSIPHPARLTPESLTQTAEHDGVNGVIGTEVRIAGQRGVIPALPEIERSIRSALLDGHANPPERG